MLLTEIKSIKVYHGTGSNNLETKLKPPLFVTTKMRGARWYANNHSTGSSKGVIIKGTLHVQKVLKADDGIGYDKFLEIAKKAGIEWTEEPYFNCPEIEKHSPYDGSNWLDIVYIPSFQLELKKEGYDSIFAYDILENIEIETYVLFNPETQFIIG